VRRRLIAAAVTAVTVLLFVATAAGSLTERGFGLTTAPSDSCALVVMSTTGAQGLAPGDRIDTRALDMHKRLHLMVTGGADAMRVPAIVRGQTRMVDIAPMPGTTPGPAAYLRIAALCALLAIGLFALWRGRDGASLGLGLFFAAVPSLFFHHAYPGLPDAAIVAVLFLSVIVVALGYLGLYGMIEALAADSPARRYFTLARAIVIAALGLVAVMSIASLSSQLFAGCAPISQLRVVFACYALVLAVGFSVLWIGMHGASPVHRRRLRWIFWSTLIGYAGPLVTYAYVAAQRPVPLDGVYNVAFLAIPMGYSYAVLRHRVIDVGFVLNRALVYTLLTTVVVGAFSLTETLAADAALGNTESALLKIAVPLAVGLSFNVLHKRVERAIEAIFFRRRREAEAALMDFARQAEHFESPRALAGRTVEEIVRWGGVRGAALYQRGGGRFVCTARAGNAAAAGAVDPDDPALVAMRTTLKHVDAGTGGSALRAGYAFPLFASGRLEGVLAVEPRETGEAFTPDELELFALVAKHVAAGLAGLQLSEYARFIESLTAAGVAEPVRSQAAAVFNAFGPP
jgi:hypothetical protein